MRRVWYRRLLVALALLLFACFAALPARASVPPAYQPVGPGDVYLALGDSLVTGTEHPLNNDGLPGYPEQILQTLQTSYPDLTLAKLGRDGETSISMVASGGQLEQAVAFIASERAAGRRVGLVTLSIGGNDMVAILPPPGGVGADGAQMLALFTANLNTIVSQLVTALTDENEERQGDLIMMDYYNPYPSLPMSPTMEALTDIWTPQFNTVIHQTAASYGVAVTEVYTPFIQTEVGELTFVNPAIYTNPTLILTDTSAFDYHPNQDGHTEIADLFVTTSGYLSDTHQLFIPLLVR